MAYTAFASRQWVVVEKGKPIRRFLSRLGEYLVPRIVADDHEAAPQIPPHIPAPVAAAAFGVEGFKGVERREP